jgi:secreted trypsin-like serine protease
MLVSASSICSATLIDRDVVLTAAHCVEGLADDQLKVVFSSQPVCEATNQLLTSEDVISSSLIRSHPGYSTEDKSNDVAMVKLSLPAPIRYQTVTLSARDTFDLQTSQILAAGFGRSVGHEMEADSAPIVLRSAKLAILRGKDLETSKIRFGESKLGSRARTSVGKQALNLLFNEGPGKEFLILNQGQGSGICSGDSGGPAFIETRDGLLQTGIAAFMMDESSVQTCLFTSGFSSMKFHRSWIEGTFEELKDVNSTIELYNE